MCVRLQLTDRNEHFALTDCFKVGNCFNSLRCVDIITESDGTFLQILIES